MQRNELVVGVLAALASSTVLCAQSKLVSPTGLTNAYGGTDNAIPFGPYVLFGNTLGEIMVQQIDEELVGTPRVLQAMAFRHQFDVAHIAKAYTATVRLGDAASGAAGISTTFANNFKVGGSSATVFSGTIRFPAQVAHSYAPSPFDAPVPFTTPFVHTGVDPLIWEVLIWSTTPVAPTIYHERGPGTTHFAGRIGAGCSAGGAALTATGYVSATTITNTLVNGPPSAPAVLMFGSTSALWNALPLPVNLAFLGSPSCDVHIDALVFRSTTTTPSGTATLPITYARTPGISGQRFRAQWVVVGSSIVTSNGLDHSVPYDALTGRPWPQSRVFANGFGTTTPVTGLIQQFGLVTEWTY
jgi:hypothetical protein